MSASTSRSASLDKIVIGDNRRLGPRQPLAQLSKTKLSALIVLMAAAVLTGLFLVYTHLQNITLSYRISQAFKEQKEMQDLNRKLRIELANMKSLARLEALAAEKYGMAPPEARQIVNVP